jgi:hypothetical protein
MPVARLSRHQNATPDNATGINVHLDVIAARAFVDAVLQGIDGNGVTHLKILSRDPGKAALKRRPQKPVFSISTHR